MTDAYKNAGVNIDAGNLFVENIKPLIASTKRHGVITGIGGFGGLFALDTSDIKEPVLVSGTDGVGTKLKIAIDLGVLNTIGIDLVAMCVNDIVCTGAQPLFFLDYFATSKLDPIHHPKIIEGIAKACRETKCALIGGETAEMPDIYDPEDFDLAGFAVGLVDRKKIIDGSEIRVGNAIIGIASSGFHSNGYALVRKILRDANLDLNKKYEGIEGTLGEALLKPTILYSPLIAQLMRSYSIKGIAHITGGGFWDNIPRILPVGVAAAISKNSWSIPQLFRLFQQHGKVDENELLRVFNCGIGMILVVPQNEAAEIVSAIEQSHEKAFVIGEIKPRAKNAPVITID